MRKTPDYVDGKTRDPRMAPQDDAPSKEPAKRHREAKR
jgi:hypothetical protein